MNSCCWLVEYKELLAFPREPFVYAKVSAGGCGAGYCWTVVVAIKETKKKLNSSVPVLDSEKFLKSLKSLEIVV